MAPEPATQPQNGQHPRIRFAKKELVKILTVLERIDGDELNAGMRLITVEDERDDARSEAKRWRSAYQEAMRLMEETSSLTAVGALERLDEAVRIWVGKA